MFDDSSWQVLLGIFGTILTLALVALVIGLIIWMWGGDWWRGLYSSFIDAFELGLKVVITLVLVVVIVAIVMLGIGLSWAPLLDNIYGGN